MKVFLRANAGWVLIGIFCAIPVIRWMMINDFSALFENRFLLISTASKIAAIIGTMLYAINFVLALRASWLESLFGGMNKVYIAHHITGGLALIFVSLHPLFIGLRYINDLSASSFQSAADALLPDKVVLGEGIQKFMESAAVNFGTIAYIGLVVLLLVTFFIKLPYGLWLKTHKFLGVSFLIAGLHIIYISSDVKNDLPLRLYLVVWIGLGLAAFVHRTLVPNIFVQRFKYTVTRVANLSSNVVNIVLSPKGKHIPFKAGQFIFVRFTNSKVVSKEMHPFSLVSKEGSDELELQIKYLGDFTSKLGSLEVGTKAQIEGAFGRFSPHRYRTGDQVWIAGGIGITPFLSSARSFREDMQKTWLFHAVNDRSELVSDAEFNAITIYASNKFTYEAYVKSEHTDFLSAAYIASKIEGDLTSKTFFICGPPPMMQSLRVQLKAAGVPNKRIISEEFSIQ